MSNNILSRIEKRLKKVESKVSSIKDNYEEMENNLEDIYDTINDLNTNDSICSINPREPREAKEAKTADGEKNNKQISNYIDKIINKTTYTPTKINNLKTNSQLFYKKLIHNQPQLTDNSIKEHITYFLAQPEEQCKNILENLNTVVEFTNSKVPRLFKILNSSLDTYHKKLALTKLHILETMQKTDSEYFKISQWLDTFLDIPFNIYKTPSYMNPTIISNPAKYLIDSKTHLDTVIFGQDKTKQHIIEIIARMIQNPKTRGSVFAIYGEAGTGKTTLIKDGLSQIFGLPFIFISLGGAQDRATLAGSNYVYEGSSCGKIIQSIKQSQCMNPIFYFDELDKTSGTEKGNEIINLLIHLTDYTQNCHFMDDYMDGIAIDLSRATFIFSFNDKSKISPILLDRMEIIRFNSYSTEEKVVIARDFLLPNIVKNVFNDDNVKIVISDTHMAKIINSNEGRTRIRKFENIMKPRKHKFFRNGGVRYIKKILERIVSRINMNQILEQHHKINKKFQNKKTDIIVSDKTINDILGN